MKNKIKILIPAVLIMGLILSGCLGGYPGSAEGVVKANIEESFSIAEKRQGMMKYGEYWNSTRGMNLVEIKVEDTEEMKVEDLADEDTEESEYGYGYSVSSIERDVKAALKNENGDGELDEDEREEEVDEDEEVKKVEVEVKWEIEEEDGDMEEGEKALTYYLVEAGGGWRIAHRNGTIRWDEPVEDEEEYPPYYSGGIAQ